ncbi:MAG: hypothetical protein R3F11_09805 [Verrucomicrobiales bacterium]
MSLDLLTGTHAAALSVGVRIGSTWDGMPSPPRSPIRCSAAARRTCPATSGRRSFRAAEDLSTSARR